MLRAVAEFLSRPLCEVLVLVAVVFGAVHYAGSKPDGGQSQMPPRSGEASHPRSLSEPEMEDVGAGEGFDSLPAVSNLTIAAILREIGITGIVVAWPPALRPEGDVVDVYGATNLHNFVKVKSVDISGCASNALVAVSDVEVSGVATNTAGFLAVGDAADTDNDGVPDAEERFVRHTDPALFDTDGDGLSDGEEVAMGTDPVSSDTDGDGLPDAQEIPHITFGDALPVFDVSVLTNFLSWSFPSQPISAAFAVDLPFTVNMAGRRTRLALVHTEGMVTFVEDGDAQPLIVPFTSPTELYASSNGVVAAYGCMFFIASGMGSQIRAGIVHGTQGRWFVAVWSGMMHPMDYAYLSLDRSAFLVAVSEAEPDTVYVKYGTLTSNVDGSTGIVGAHGFDGVPDMTIADCVQGSVTNGMTIAYRFGTGTNPVNADTDGDGLLDAWEYAYGMDPLVNNLIDGNPRTNADADPDIDGLSNSQESTLGTNPFQPDTDWDGMDDAWEVMHGFDPLTHNSQTARTDDNAGADPDDDGLTNAQECEWGTDPVLEDTDGDGVDDSVEISQNSDPAAAGDGGKPNSRVAVSFFFGDHSASHSEKYRLMLSPVSGSGVGATPRPVSWINANYGECETKMAMLKPGWSYEVRLYHASTNRDQGPDYDYTLTVVDGVQSSVIVFDPQGLLGVHSSNDYFTGDGKAATIHVLAPPTIVAPMVIGVNNDDDNGNGTPDKDETGQVVGDDDLGEVNVSVMCPPGMNGTVEVTPLVGVTAGTLWKSRGRTQALETAETFSVSPGETVRTYFLEGHNPSSHYEAEGVRAVFRCSGLALTNECRFTFVERIAEPITTERSNGQIVNPCCAVIGGSTRLKVDVLPSDFPESRINWRVVSGAGSFSDATGRESVFMASGAEDDNVVVQVDVGDCPGRAPQFTMRNTTMHEVKIYPCAIVRTGRPPPVTTTQVNSMLDEVNVIYRQIGLHFSLGATLMCVTNDEWATDGLINKTIGAQICNIMSGTDGLEIYFISGREMRGEPLGKWNSHGIIIKGSASAKTFAHEVGHACRWGDIYCKSGDDIVAELYGGVKQCWMPADWNNGTGCRFYDPMLPQYQAIMRLLMYGNGGDVKCDIPLGAVYGLGNDGTLGNISVGRGTMLVTSPRSL